MADAPIARQADGDSMIFYRRFVRSPLLQTAALVLLGAALSAGVWAACGSPSVGPDVIVASLYGGWGNYVTGSPIDGKRSYSIGTKSLNIGDTNLLWEGNNNKHPVIGQNLYRLKTDAARPGGRLEQIGLSWLKHGFTALAQSEFCACDNPGTGTRLGTGCSDPYSSDLNGNQDNLGPRYQVDAATGVYTYPFDDSAPTPNALSRRIVVLDADLDTAAGVRYFAEGQYVTADDAAAGHAWNNASFREAQLSTDGFKTFSWGGALGATTQQQSPALAVWTMIDPGVAFEFVDVPEETLLARYHVAAKVHDNGDGTWRYEYAIHNLNSHRSLQRFEVPVPPASSVTGAGFHDVDYHSGEPYTVTDWTIDADAPNGFVAWFGESFATNQNANALRWGTMYNYWFDSDQAPGNGLAALTLFRPGTPALFHVVLPVPGGSILFADDFERGTVSAWDAVAP